MSVGHHIPVLQRIKRTLYIIVRSGMNSFHNCFWPPTSAEVSPGKKRYSLYFGIRATGTCPITVGSRNCAPLGPHTLRANRLTVSGPLGNHNCIRCQKYQNSINNFSYWFNFIWNYGINYFFLCCKRYNS